jgi:dipeptidyl aminopeptidase/acylaminoacyl peptidase
MRLRSASTLLLALTLPLSAAPAAIAQPVAGAEGRFTVERYLDYQTVAEARLSPDGRQIVYTRRWIDRSSDRWQSSLWIMNADGTRNRFFVNGSSPVWSRDGTRIAYLAEGEPSGTQIWVKYLDAEGASQITRTEQAPGSVRWSPDGRQIGFSMFVPTRSSWSVTLPRAPQGANWTRAPAVIDQLHYRADRRGFLEAGHTHLFLISADGGTPRQLTQGAWNVGFRFDALPGEVGWDWSPDGRTVIVEGYREPDGDMNYRDSNLYAVDVASGSTRRLSTERGTWTQPVFSPDGRWIAFRGYPHTTRSYQASDLWVMNADGSGVRSIGGGMDRDPADLTWAADGSGIYFTAQNEGSQNLHFAPLRGAPRQITAGERMFSLGTVSRDGVAVGVSSSPQNPTDVVRLSVRRPGEVTRLTRINDDLLAQIRLGEVEEIWYTSADGTRVQGWVVKPPTFDPQRRYPLIMEIHGGPHAMYNVAFNPMFQNFAAHDYVVLYTNPRGSTGYGTAFGNAIERAYPSVDYDDLMAGVDAVIALGYVDADRMFVGGCSGGGVLTSWVIAHTNRFRAASVRCPVINWLSFIGQTDVPFFVQNFFEQPFWENPEPWLHQSPLMHVGRVETPTLLMTGVLDLRTPMPQTEEYYAALRMRGVPTTLLRFEGEYHGTGSRPSNWMRTQLYMMEWYQRWAEGGN